MTSWNTLDRWVGGPQNQSQRENHWPSWESNRYCVLVSYHPSELSYCLIYCICFIHNLLSHSDSLKWIWFIFTFGCCILLCIYPTGSLWRRQLQQSFNTSTPPSLFFLLTHYMFRPIRAIIRRYIRLLTLYFNIFIFLYFIYETRFTLNFILMFLQLLYKVW
jgi:hypothetical protein